MVGVVKIRIFLLLVCVCPILYKTATARPALRVTPASKKTLIIVVPHFLFFLYISLALSPFFYFLVKIKKQQASLAGQKKQIETFLSFFFCVSATQARSVRTVTQIHCGIVGGFGRHLSPHASLSQLELASKLAMQPVEWSVALPPGSMRLRESPSFSWHGPDYPLLLLQLLLQVDCLPDLPDLRYCRLLASQLACLDRTGVTASRKILRVP